MGLNALLENQLGHLPEFHIYCLSTPGLKFSLFSLYVQRFPRYGPIFEMPYLGMKLGHLPKGQKLHIYSLSTPGGGEIELIFALRAAVSEIWADF